MIYYTPLATAAQWEWVFKRARPILSSDSCGILAVRDTGELLAGAVMDSFTNTACNVHMAIENPIVLRHGFLEKVAEEVFLSRNRKTIFGLTPSNNAKALKFNEHIGMKYVTEIPDAYDEGVGYVVTRMDRESSPWLQRLMEVA